MRLYLRWALLAGASLAPLTAAMAQTTTSGILTTTQANTTGQTTSSGGANTSGAPNPGTPGENVFFGGASGNPQPVQNTTVFGNTAASVFGTTGAQAGPAQGNTGGLSDIGGTASTGGLTGTNRLAPVGGLRDAFRASTGGTQDINLTSAPTGGIRQASTVGFGVPGSSITGGRLDAYGTAGTGGASVGNGFLTQQQQ